MQRVSIRTLSLLIELLLALASHQYMVVTRPNTGLMWLAGNCDTTAHYQGALPALK